MDVKACVAALPDCEPLVLEHCIRTYSLPADGRKEDKDNGVSSEVGGALPGVEGVSAILRLYRTSRDHRSIMSVDNESVFFFVMASF